MKDYLHSGELGTFGGGPRGRGAVNETRPGGPPTIVSCIFSVALGSNANNF